MHDVPEKEGVLFQWFSVVDESRYSRVECAKGALEQAEFSPHEFVDIGTWGVFVAQKL